MKITLGRGNMGSITEVCGSGRKMRKDTAITSAILKQSKILALFNFDMPIVA
jgi:hypothetical protein